MFPLNLQKNIQELERQISLLETECEHMETEKQELTGKSNSKSMIRELPNQPFITGPSQSIISYSPKILNLPPTVPKLYSASCTHFRTIPDKFPRASTPKCGGKSRNNRVNDSDPPEKNEEAVCREVTLENCLDEKTRTSTETTPEHCERETKENCKRSIICIKEVSESSEENYSPQNQLCCKLKPNNNSKETAKEQPWCELLREHSPPAKWQEGCKNKQNAELLPTHNFSEPKLSSDEECKKELIGGITKSLGGNWPNEYESQVSPESRLSKRKSRSVRTKKNYEDEVPLDLNMTKVSHEKEIQCMLWNEDKNNEKFFFGLNESIKILHYLVGELQTKLSREKRGDVLNNMQKTILKLSNYKSINFLDDPIISLKETGLKLENDDNIMDVKNMLLALKQFCKELSDEKLALTEEVTKKNRALVSFKNKEKEYLGFISSLKFNLEKMKEEADEGVHARRDLKILKVKLQEETKVIEALKKSHEKMQELIENYVLENDKLWAQVKIAKLESQKYNVLLAGKEAEISKYKKEIESFQKQITGQLSLLRSKATENEVEQTLEAISSQRNKIPAEVEAEEGDDFNDNLGDTMESTTTISHGKNDVKELSPSAEQLDDNTKNVWEIQSNSTEGRNLEEGNTKNPVFMCNEAEVGRPTKRPFGLERVLSSSKNLRCRINELLEDIRQESSEMYCPSPSNSCLTSSQSILVSTSSDDVSEGDQNN